MCLPFCNPPVQQPTRISMETTSQQSEEETIHVLTLRAPLQDRGLANDDTLQSLAGGISFAPAANEAVTDDTMESIDFQVSALPILPSSSSIANVTASRSSSSVTAAPSGPAVHNGKAPRSMFVPRPRPITQCNPPIQRGPVAAKKMPDEGTAEVEFTEIQDMTEEKLCEWAESVLGGDEASLPRKLVWRLHLSKLVLQKKPFEDPEAERKRVLATRDAIRSLLFVEHDGISFLGPLAVAGRAYLNNEGNSMLRLVNLQDDVVTSETRTLPVNPDRVWYNCHLYMHDPIRFYP